MVSVLQPRPTTHRALRQPEVPFSIKHTAWELTPFCIFPVLPGETLKTGMWQSRVITDPLAASIIGAHIEYYFYYVKLRDIAGQDANINNMFLDPNFNATAMRSAASVPHYHSYGINWMKLCMEQAIADHFRAEGETATQFVIDQYPAASIRLDNWLDSAMTTTEYDPVGAVNVDLNANGTITVEEIRMAQRAYDLARTMNIADGTFEDYLRMQGVNVPNDKAQMSEELRYVRNWSYPTNTIDPVTGAPTSALSWSVAERLDKDRFFLEPGFVIGLSVLRPKIYLQNQKGSVTGLMDNVFRWLPDILNNDPETSYLQITDANKANGPLQNQTVGYWFDLRDLLLYGEQYVNYTMGTAGNNHIAMPTAGLQKYYPDLAMAKSIFKDAAGTKWKVHQDGICQMRILGRQFDTTPTPLPPNV